MLFPNPSRPICPRFGEGFRRHPSKIRDCIQKAIPWSTRSHIALKISKNRLSRAKFTIGYANADRGPGYRRGIASDRPWSRYIAKHIDRANAKIYRTT